MQESEINWDRLKRIRQNFLADGPATGVYWENEEDLELYHQSFAARIGWKWDSVLGETSKLGFKPRGKTLIDWGCGSGIASLRTLEAFGPDAFDTVLLWDHSLLACRFAQKKIEDSYPEIQVTIASGPDCSQWQDTSQALVLVSHTLNEMSQEAQSHFAAALKPAAQVIFVEPGTHSSSHKLLKMRETLEPQFNIAAPCTHCSACPMLLDGNTRHWCHFFAKAPVEAFTDGFWTRFSQSMEIDLRSLPFSYLVLENKELKPGTPLQKGRSRLIGRPRQFKGYTRLLSCDEHGLRELELQKRDDKQLWKALKKGPDSSLYDWGEIDADSSRLKSGKAL